MEYQFTLENNSRKHLCPQCNKKTLVRYIDTTTNDYINFGVGRCDRESNCGYHYTPKQYFQDNNIATDTAPFKTNKPIKLQSKPVSFIPIDIFKASLKAYNNNNFIIFLIDHFGIEITNELISRYYIGTSKYWEGATVFWQVDIHGKIRTGKIMLYNAETGKRVKEPYNHIAWAHNAIKQPEFALKQCLFGEHLIANNNKPIAIVESEKTAIISSVYLPQFIWLAAGSLSNLNAEKCIILKGRNVILFPDLNGYEKWCKKALELSNIAKFQVSSMLEARTTDFEKKMGNDIVDYLLKFELSEFQTVFKI